MRNTVKKERIDYLIDSAIVEAKTVFGKCTVVAVKTIDGFVLVESSACVSVENYNEDIGKEICLERIKNKLWELEGYKLQYELTENYNENPLLQNTLQSAT